MKPFDEETRRRLDQYFAGREDIGLEGVLTLFVRDPRLDADSTRELLLLLQAEFRVPAGVLRPDDAVDTLFDPISSANPFKWMEYRIRVGDAKAELAHQLHQRLVAAGTTEAWGDVSTLLELAQAWGGHRPSSH